MFRITNFHELMKGLPRSAFDRMVRERNADKYCKNFGHWEHLIAMLYAQLSGASGLRPLEASFNAHASHHYHLGVSSIRRSTLAGANDKRSDAVFGDITTWLMGKVSRKLRSDSEELMYLLDSTSITLKGKNFDEWTFEKRNRNTQGIKLHVLYDAHRNVPVWTDFSAANVNDVERATAVPLEEGARYVFDKGYTNYNWWSSINDAKALFVTRFKRNAGLKVKGNLEIPQDAAGVVLADEIVQFKSRNPGGKRVNEYFGKQLRRITIARPDKDTPIVLATNDFTSTALEIAQRYKERWGIELFFKWIKQHLKIKHFLGRSENAVRIQILTALISYLLVALQHQATKSTQSLWHFFCMISTTLFQRPETEATVHRRRRERQLINEKQGRLF